MLKKILLICLSLLSLGLIAGCADEDPCDSPFPNEGENEWYPKSNSPARHLDAVDFIGLDKWERLAMICLQGLTSRKRPSIWMLTEAKGGSDLKWLNVHKEKSYIESYEIVTDWKRLFVKHREVYNGAVVPDEELYHGLLHAVNVAACEGLIVAPEPLANELGIPIKIDLRDRFKTNAEGYGWIWDTYKHRLNQKLCGIFHPDLAFVGSLAYDIQWRGFVFWVSGLLEISEIGTNPLAELEVMTEILKELPPNIPVRGYPWYQNLGMLENPGVRWLSSYGKVHNPSDVVSNLSVMSGVRIDKLTQPEPPPLPPLEKENIYIALTMTDGDNFSTYDSYFSQYFEHEDHGRFPMGWGMGPGIIDVMPAVAEWFYERAAPNHEFICDVSGIGYVYPDFFAYEYDGDTEGIRKEFQDWTARYMQRMDMKHVRTYFDSRKEPAAWIEEYFQGIPFLEAVWDGYCLWKRLANAPYEKQTYTLNGKPVFSPFLKPTWIYGNQNFYKDLFEIVKDQRPAFVNGCVINWDFKMDELMNLYNSRDSNMVFVSPSQLTQLYQEARERGWTR